MTNKEHLRKNKRETEIGTYKKTSQRDRYIERGEEKEIKKKERGTEKV